MDSPEMSIKKSKKSSKHKRSTPQILDDDSSDLQIADETVTKCKSSSSSSTSSIPVVTPPSSSSLSATAAAVAASKKRKRRDSASSDEERWLTAIESGKLEDVDDELKKIKPKDPALMTARQRAMYDRGIDGNTALTTTLMSLPTGYKEKVMTAEAIQKAAIKSQKRKQLADEKREKDKKKTMERLLKKQESKATKLIKSKISRSNVPMIIYRQSLKSTTLTFPPEMELPFSNSSQQIEPPKPVLCSMGCGNLKKYTCSRTNAPLCSLVCFKRNICSRIL